MRKHSAIVRRFNRVVPELHMCRRARSEWIQRSDDAIGPTNAIDARLSHAPLDFDMRA